MSEKVVMTCMTTKQKFDVENPPVTVLSNGRYAYRVQCPWAGKNGKELYAFKFCSAAAYRAYASQCEQVAEVEQGEQNDAPGSPESPA